MKVFPQHLIATCTLRLVALLIALELGLLSPLSCVIHCLVQQVVAERPAVAFFLCSEHSGNRAASVSVPLTDADASSIPFATIAPRALYEFVSLAIPLFIAAILLIGALFVPPAHCFAPRPVSPPTPPPRLSRA